MCAVATTSLIAKIVGPVLLLRALSIVIDREHFVAMTQGLAREVSTVSFSLFPIALLMVCIAGVVLHTDRSSLAAILIRLMFWGGMLKAAALILVPGFVVSKALLLERAGFLNVVLLVTFALGGYLTWFGYVGSRATGGRAGPRVAAD